MVVSETDEVEAREVLERLDESRIRVARELAGWSQQELAHSLGVSQTAINRYERGWDRPSSKRLAQIARVLSRPIEFFSSGFDMPEDVESDSGRSPRPEAELLVLVPRRIELRLQREAMAQSRLFAQMARVLASEGVIPPLELPDLSQEDPGDRPFAEALAERLRSRWNLRSDPAPSVIEELENRGLLVTTVLGRTDPDWGYTGPFDWNFSVPFEPPYRPLIFLGGSLGSDLRYGAALGLGSIIDWRSVPASDRKTRRASAEAFALEWLMPRGRIGPQLAQAFEADSTASLLEELLVLRGIWKVSVVQLLHRAESLDPQRGERCAKARRVMRARGWLTREPGPFYQAEEPRILEQAMGDRGLRIADVARAANIPIPLASRFLTDGQTADSGELFS